MSKKQHPLRFNVGYIIHETPGYAKDFSFEFPFYDLGDDFTVKDFKGELTFSRTQKGILLDAHLQAVVATECTRCLDATLTPIESRFTELYAFDHRTETESELIVPEQGYIDITDLGREYLLLDTPTTPLCKPDCAGLCPICGENLNHGHCDCEVETIDPRLSKLKDLLNDE
ncbi:MAG: DUF177 domain-containing protein [Anaerolineales bacterium]